MLLGKFNPGPLWRDEIMRYDPPSERYHYGHLTFSEGYKISLEDWYHWIVGQQGKEEAKNILDRILATRSNEISIKGLKYLWERDESKKNIPFPFK